MEIPNVKTPQIGLEFVNQYYKILQLTPHDLYKFYSCGSRYSYNGEEPMIGQVEINTKIHQLSFKDCHTKILQVDSKQYLKSALSDFSSSEKLSMHLAKEAVIDLRNKLFSFSYQINKK